MCPDLQGPRETQSCHGSDSESRTLPSITSQHTDAKDSKCDVSYLCALDSTTYYLPTGLRQKKIDEFLPEEEQIYQSQGLVSIDRSEAAALLSTTPRLRRRSSTDDLAPLHRMGWILLRHPGPRSRAGQLSFAVASPSQAPNPVGLRLSLPPDAGARQYRYIFGRDSDLEAFSHNPPDGSFAPLAYQPST